MKIEFKFIEDPGHAWLMVHKDIAKQVGYAPTSYDYETEDHYYFEEDCSAGAFVKAYKAHHTDREVSFDSEYQERFRDMVERVDISPDREWPVGHLGEV